MNIKNLILIASLVLSPTIFAAGSASAFDKYKSGGAANFSASNGEKLWQRQVHSAKDNKMRSCSSCHTDNLTQMGKHHRTGKPIKPMAPSANSARFTKVKKIEKWFKRNCKWTWGRECTAQEKGDILTYLINYK
ncbi:MAG: DUF1924 domain-containing protein [Chromatiales bacterium]|nr:DUF1924 domain-containing protein [Chromatiales bacterium]